jgi:IS30 family transposase
VPVRMCESKRAEVRRLYFEVGAKETARIVQCAETMVFKLVKHYPRAPRLRDPRRLSIEDREELSRALPTGESSRSIAKRLSKSPSTISREVARCGGRLKYRAWLGEQLASQAALRPKLTKFELHPPLRAAVERMLADKWSPEQIAARLVVDYPTDLRMRATHETIYRALYVQGRGSLRKILSEHLRKGRKLRRRKRPGGPQERIKDMVMISDRPAEAEDRAVPGHWEGDLIIGKEGRSAIGTLVERHSRFVILLHLANGRTAESMRQALAKQVKTLPKQLWRTLTWDQGIEMKAHAQFTIDTGVQVYFCNPSSPWQRGSNENTNGLLRQYFPKGQDLSVYSQRKLDEVARQLNNRPRQTLKWMKPSEVFAQAVASTA